jgi:hypothetical protein
VGVDQQPVARVAHQIALQHEAVKRRDTRIAAPFIAQQLEPLAEVGRTEIVEPGPRARRLEYGLRIEGRVERLAPGERAALRVGQLRRREVVDVDRVSHGARIPFRR